MLIIINLYDSEKSCYSCRKCTEENGWLWNMNETLVGQTWLTDKYPLSKSLILSLSGMWADIKTGRSHNQIPLKTKQACLVEKLLNILPIKINIPLWIRAV